MNLTEVVACVDVDKFISCRPDSVNGKSALVRVVISPFSPTFSAPFSTSPPRLMLDLSLTPTRLIDPATRPPLQIIEPERPSLFRNFEVLVGVARLAGLLMLLKMRHRRKAAEYGVRLRLLLEQMGGLWFKVGQLLSLRLDILPLEVCRELGQLQNRGIGFPGVLARQVLERELNGPIEDTFAE